MIQGIPPEWRQNKSMTPNDIDEDVDGSDNYDVWHEDATEDDSIEQLPESIMELEPLEEPGDAAGVHKGITELEPLEEPGDIMGIKEVKKKGKN